MEDKDLQNYAPDTPQNIGPLLRHGTGPFDVGPYMDDLKDFAITDEEKVAFLETLCLIMKTFVDISWGVDSVQRVFPPLTEVVPAADFNDVAEGREADHD